MKLVKIVKTDSGLVAILQTVLCTKIKFQILILRNATVVHVSPELNQEQQNQIIEYVLSGEAKESMLLRVV